MDPNTVLAVMCGGAALGVLVGFMMSGEGYGWVFNAISGATGAVFGGEWLSHSAIDMGQWVNVGAAALVASSLTAMVLRAG
jgi:uncharacterized membrane protein YeaQ/YmgE (transglycosylase-associated protein family)